MNTSRTTSVLSKPVNGERIPNGVIEYINTRNRMRLFSVVQEEFIKSGLTQAELAHRMGKGTDRICHILGSPGNWTSDTASALIFSMLGGVIQYSITYP